MSTKRIKRYSRRFGVGTALKLYAHYRTRKVTSLGDITIQLPGLAAPLTVRRGTTDFAIFEQIFVNREYELPFSFSPRVILDVGANTGFSAIYFATTYPDAHVYAVEPEPSNFRMLELNTRAYANITPIQKALWSHTGPAFIVDASRETKDGFQVSSSGGSLQIQGITLEDLLKKFGLNKVDLLKLDIEGGEKEIFTPDSSSWLSKVDVLAVELHDSRVPGCSRAFYLATAAEDFAEYRRGENIVLYRPNVVAAQRAA